MSQHYEKKLLKYKLDLWPANFFYFILFFFTTLFTMSGSMLFISCNSGPPHDFPSQKLLL